MADIEQQARQMLAAEYAQPEASRNSASRGIGRCCSRSAQPLALAWTSWPCRRTSTTAPTICWRAWASESTA